MSKYSFSIRPKNYFLLRFEGTVGICDGRGGFAPGGLEPGGRDPGGRAPGGLAPGGR